MERNRKAEDLILQKSSLGKEKTVEMYDSKGFDQFVDVNEMVVKRNQFVLIENYEFDFEMGFDLLKEQVEIEIGKCNIKAINESFMWM